MKKRIYYYTFTILCIFIAAFLGVEYIIRQFTAYAVFSKKEQYIVMLFISVIFILLVSYILPKVIIKKISDTITQLVHQLDVINYPEEDNQRSSSYLPELLPAVNTISELRENQKSYIRKLEESEKIRHDFTANVSHELKTPLTTIKGFGEMLEQGLISNKDDTVKYGSIIFRESSHLLSLIDDIIQLGKIETKTSDSFISFSVMPIVRDCIEILSDKAENTRISLSLRGEEGVKVYGNSLYISELIINIVDNSIKYNKPNGNVWISVFEDEENAIISIKDDGIGIKEQYHKRVFERFFRVDQSHCKAIEGTGLGLAIAKHIVTLHNGTLQLFSKYGEGTEIIIRLPKKHHIL